MAVQHRRRHLAVAVVGRGHRHPGLTEQVGLVVDDDVAVAVRPGRRRHPQHHVDRAGEVAPQRLVAERARSAVRRTTRAGRRRAGAPQQRRHVARGVRRRARSRAGRRRSAGTRSRARRAGRAAGCRPGAAPRRAAPSGVSCDGSSASASSSAPTPTGHQGSCSRVRAASSARRSGASGSLTSSTPCTRLPKAAPDGRAAIGDGTPGLARDGDRLAASSSIVRSRRRAPRHLGLGGDPARAAPAPGSARSTTCAATRCRPRGRTARAARSPVDRRRPATAPRSRPPTPRGDGPPSSSSRPRTCVT